MTARYMPLIFIGSTACFENFLFKKKTNYLSNIFYFILDIIKTTNFRQLMKLKQSKKRSLSNV